MVTLKSSSIQDAMNIL